MPSLSNSPWIRGAPHSGLAMLISRISLRISVGKVGRPPRRRDLQRQYDLNPARCHFITVSGFKTARAFRTVGANRYSPAKIKRSMALNVCLLESVRTLQAGLQSFLSMRRIEARRKNAKAFRLRHSQSLARR